MEGASISVIIPTWNRVNTLGRAIESVLAQTLQPLEILVCDDGSDDGTHEMICQYNNPLIKWLPGKRAGRPAVPRNRGIAQSKGEWMAFLDSDDEWVSDKLEKQLAAAHTWSLKAVCSNALRVPQQLPYFQLPNAIYSFDDFMAHNPVICSSVLFHRSLIDRITGFPESPALKAIEDYALWIRVASLTSFVYLSECLVTYSDNPAASVRANDVTELEQRKLIGSDFIQWSSVTSIERRMSTKIIRNFIDPPSKRFRIRDFLTTIKRLWAK